MLGAGFEPTHSKVIGLKPIALDRSANLTDINRENIHLYIAIYRAGTMLCYCIIEKCVAVKLC